MDFTAWNWSSHFRLHEAACLIGGVMPISKRHPTSEELPPQAKPVLIKLVSAYYEWFLQKMNPERPKSIVLEGVLNEDGSLPPFPSLTDVTGEVISRDAIHRFLTLMAERGLKSCYDFGPFGKAGPPHEMGHQTQAEAPAPVVDIASNSTTPDPERRLALLRALGGSATYKRDEWKFKGITALVASEKSERRKRSDEQTIRADLREAAQNELEAKRAGFGSGLGQR